MHGLQIAYMFPFCRPFPPYQTGAPASSERPGLLAELSSKLREQQRLLRDQANQSQSQANAALGPLEAAEAALRSSEQREALLGGSCEHLQAALDATKEGCRVIAAASVAAGGADGGSPPADAGAARAAACAGAEQRHLAIEALFRKAFERLEQGLDLRQQASSARQQAAEGVSIERAEDGDLYRLRSSVLMQV